MFELLEIAIDSAIDSGAKYSDARVLISKSRSIAAKNGEIENGSRLLYEFTQDKNTKSEISITVKEITPNKLLNQVGGIPFILTFNHTYTLVPNGDATKVIIHEDYNGIGVNFWNPQPVEIAYGRLNEALKKRVEFLN